MPDNDSKEVSIHLSIVTFISLVFLPIGGFLADKIGKKMYIINIGLVLWLTATIIQVYVTISQYVVDGNPHTFLTGSFHGTWNGISHPYIMGSYSNYWYVAK